MALVSSAIFRAVDADVDADPANHHTYLGKNGVAWVLRFGGLCTLVRLPYVACLQPCAEPDPFPFTAKFGAAICRMVPPTRTEKEMRRLIGEMNALKKEPNP